MLSHEASVVPLCDGRKSGSSEYIFHVMYSWLLHLLELGIKNQVSRVLFLSSCWPTVISHTFGALVTFALCCLVSSLAYSHNVCSFVALIGLELYFILFHLSMKVCFVMLAMSSFVARLMKGRLNGTWLSGACHSTAAIKAKAMSRCSWHLASNKKKLLYQAWRMISSSKFSTGAGCCLSTSCPARREVGKGLWVGCWRLSSPC